MCRNDDGWLSWFFLENNILSPFFLLFSFSCFASFRGRDVMHGHHLLGNYEAIAVLSAVPCSGQLLKGGGWYRYSGVLTVAPGHLATVALDALLVEGDWTRFEG